MEMYDNYFLERRLKYETSIGICADCGDSAGSAEDLAKALHWWKLWCNCALDSQYTEH